MDYVLAITYYNSNTLCLSSPLLDKIKARTVIHLREKKEINIQIGEHIKAARESRQLTQERLAEEIDVSPQYISDLERGVVGVSIATLKKICLALRVSSDQILFDAASNDILLPVVEKCRSLSQAHLEILCDIIEKYLTAVSLYPET